MDIHAHWRSIAAHPMGGWRQVAEPALPTLDPGKQLLWGGIGGSRLPSQTLARAVGVERAFRNWVPLASAEAPPASRLRAAAEENGPTQGRRVRGGRCLVGNCRGRGGGTQRRDLLLP